MLAIRCRRKTAWESIKGEFSTDFAADWISERWLTAWQAHHAEDRNSFTEYAIWHMFLALTCLERRQWPNT